MGKAKYSDDEVKKLQDDTNAVIADYVAKTGVPAQPAPADLQFRLVYTPGNPNLGINARVSISSGLLSTGQIREFLTVEAPNEREAATKALEQIEIAAVALRAKIADDGTWM